MHIDCHFTYQSCTDRHFVGSTAVVIDVLRATSSMITALLAGAAAIIPVAQIAKALALKEQMPNALLSGEREGERLEGFDMGNSPLEFTAEACAGRIIIACTTNGTAAIQQAHAADHIWLGALLNAQAVAEQVCAQGVEKLTILCSGTDGYPSLDDTVTAGAILHHFNKVTTLDSHSLNDTAVMAWRLYDSYANADMYQALAQSKHGQKLIRFGWDRDVRFCAQQNSAAIVPWLDKSSGRICNPAEA